MDSPAKKCNVEPLRALLTPAVETFTAVAPPVMTMRDSSHHPTSDENGAGLTADGPEYVDDRYGIRPKRAHGELWPTRRTVGVRTTLKLPASFDDEYAKRGYVVTLEPAVTESE